MDEGLRRPHKERVCIAIETGRRPSPAAILHQSAAGKGLHTYLTLGIAVSADALHSLITYRIKTNTFQYKHFPPLLSRTHTHKQTERETNAFVRTCCLYNAMRRWSSLLLSGCWLLFSVPLSCKSNQLSRCWSTHFSFFRTWLWTSWTLGHNTMRPHKSVYLCTYIYGNKSCEQITV